MLRALLLGLALLGLVGCAGVVDSPYASEEAVRAKTYRHPGPPALTLLTMVSNRSGGGGHSALMINGSQRVIFDPAGSFQHELVPERHDVLFGITPAVLAGYKSAHARSAYHVVLQTVEVSPEQAEIALRLAQSNGPTIQAACTNATARLIRQVPGFQDAPPSLFPNRLRDYFASRPDVVTERYFEDDDGGILEGVQKVQIE